MTPGEIGIQALLRWLLFPAIAVPVCIYARRRGRHGFVERLAAWLAIIPVALGASFLGLWPFVALLTACAVVAAWEIARLGVADVGSSPPSVKPAMSPVRLFVALACALPWLVWAATSPAYPAAAAAAAAVAPMVLFFALPRAAALRWSVPLLAASCGAALSFWVLLQRLPGGFRWVLVPFSVVVISDVLAFVTGRFLPGRHPFPALSPGKTVTGYAGGFLSAPVVASMVWFAVPEFGFAALLAASLLLACTGAAGDLWASAVKRRYATKDFSGVLGAQGGMLDRLDSLLGSGWVFYAFVRLFVL